jgi:hypothetical protein
VLTQDKRYALVFPICLDKGKRFSTTSKIIIIILITNSIERKSRRLKTSGIFNDFWVVATNGIS